VPHDNSLTPVSAVLRIGDHAPARLIGAPVACPAAEPGTATVILGWTDAGDPVELTIGSGAWLRDLFGAVVDAGVENFASITPAVTP